MNSNYLTVEDKAIMCRWRMFPPPVLSAYRKAHERDAEIMAHGARELHTNDTFARSIALSDLAFVGLGNDVSLQDRRYAAMAIENGIFEDMRDFSVSGHGSLALVHLHSVMAQNWVSDYVSEPMYHGYALVVEPRYLDDLIAGMEADGLRADT